MNGYSIAENITKKHSKTFYFASRFLEKTKRRAAYTIYAVCRSGDDAVDNTLSPLSKKKILEELMEQINFAYLGNPSTNSLLSAFGKTVNDYGIPKRYFDTLKEGMIMDLTVNRYKNFDELYDYCYKVAGVVGLIMLRIFDGESTSALQYAVDLGIAMQLTNILRDVKEDFERGRVYLPSDEMALYGISYEDILKQNLNNNFKELLKFQISRTRKYYEKAKEGIRLIKDKNSKFVVFAMAELYAGILSVIEKSDYDIFTRRAYLKTHKKIGILLKILFNFKKFKQ